MTAVERVRAWRRANPEKLREQRRMYWVRHPEKRRARLKAWRDGHQDHLREYERRRYEREGAKMRERLRVDRLKRPSEYRRRDMAQQLRQYGLTTAVYTQMVEAQRGVCAICGGWPSGRGKAGQRLHVDHDHATKRNRALLCERCNLSLGKFHDDPVLLRAAASYLEKWRAA